MYSFTDVSQAIRGDGRELNGFGISLLGAVPGLVTTLTFMRLTTARYTHVSIILATSFENWKDQVSPLIPTGPRDFTLSKIDVIKGQVAGASQRRRLASSIGVLSQSIRFSKWQNWQFNRMQQSRRLPM